MAAAKKRDLEPLGNLGFSPGSKDRKIELSRDDLKGLIKDLGTEDFATSPSPLSSRSTSTGDSSGPAGTSTPTPKGTARSLTPRGGLDMDLAMDMDTTPSLINTLACRSLCSRVTLCDLYASKESRSAWSEEAPKDAGR